MTVLNNFASAFGSDAVAAVGIAQKLNMIPFQIALGSSQGIMPLVSYNYSSGNRKRMKNAILFTSAIAVSFLTAVTVGYYFGAAGLVRMFMKTPAVVEYGTRFLQGICLALPFLCIDFIAVGVFQACGLGRLSLVFAILRKIVLEIPALNLFNRISPLYGLAYAQPAAEVILAIAAVFVLLRLLRCPTEQRTHGN